MERVGQRHGVEGAAGSEFGQDQAGNDQRFSGPYDRAGRGGFGDSGNRRGVAGANVLG